MTRAHAVKILMVVATIAGVVAVAPYAQAQQAKPLEISIIEATPAFHTLPVFALKTIGAEYNLKLESLQVQGGGDAGLIFAGGHGDIMMSGIDKPLGFMAKKMVDVKVFGALLTAMNWSLVAPAKADIKTVADLKGKTIGISGPGSSSDMLMRWALNKAGLNPDKDVTMIALGSVANLYAGVENERVNAAVLVQPFLKKALDTGTYRIVGDWEAMEYPNMVAMARTEDLKKSPEKFVRFQSALKSVLGRFKTDREFALKMAKLAYPNASTEELSQQLDHAIKVLWKPMDGEMTRKLYDQAVDLLVGSGRVSKGDMPSYEAVVVNLPTK